MTRHQALTLARLRKWFLQGFAIAAPVLVTLAIVVWIASLIESFVGHLLRFLLSDSLYLPGMGLALGLLLLVGIGMLANLFLVRRVVSFAERLLDRIPVVKTLFKGIKDVSNLLTTRQKGEKGKVVSVDLGGFHLIGFVMQAQAMLRADAPTDEAWVAVYLPMSYQLGGYTLYLPRERVTPLDVSAEDAMRAILTGGELGARQAGARSAANPMPTGEPARA